MFLEGNSWCSVSERHFDSFALVTTGSCQPYLRGGRTHLRFLPAHLQHSTAMPLPLTAPTVSSFVGFGATCSPVKTLFAPHTYLPLGRPRGGIPVGQRTQNNVHLILGWKLKEIGQQSRLRKLSSCLAPAKSVLPRVEPPGGLK